MRINLISAVIVFIALQVKAAPGYGQDKITLKERNAPLTKVLEDLRKVTGMYYAIQSQNSTATLPVTLSVKDATLVEVLDLTFKGQPVTYEIVDKIIVVKKREVSQLDASPPADSGHVTMVSVQGVVMSESGQPLAGANVTIRQTLKGTVTDEKGAFNLGEIPSGSTILVTFIGYVPQQMTVKDASNVRVFLKVATNELDRVVVQAYGNTTQRLQTGDIATVSAATIEKQPVINPLLTLQGQVPGLDIVQQSGYASAPVKVELRGRSALGNFPSDPLYIVDGVPLSVNEFGGGYPTSTGFLQTEFSGPADGQSPLYSVNSDDIESITVLKDADATAIYGSRGANGVIIITTKKGKAGRSKFDVKVEQGAMVITRFLPMLNTSQYLAVRREAFKNDGLVMTNSSAYDLVTWDTTRYTNWEKYIEGGMGHTTNVQTALSGGDAHTTYRIAGGYKRFTGITTISGADQQGSLSFDLTRKSTDDRFTVELSAQYTLSQANIIGMPGNITMAPDAPPVYDSIGNLNYEGWQPIARGYPFSNLKISYVSNTTFLNSNLILSYQPLRGLVLKTNFGYNNGAVKQLGLLPIASQYPFSNPQGRAQFGQNDNVNWVVEPQASYDAFLSKGKFSVLLGGSLQDATTTGAYQLGSGYTNDALLRTITDAPTINAQDIYGQFKFAGIFGRINYNWENEFILNLSARRDGSSKFGPGDQYGNFGAVGAAWIFTEEGWFKRNLPVLSFGKLRASYGTTGSDAVTPYSYLTRYSASGLYPYEGVVPLEPTQHANPNYQWQVNKKLEAAVELGFFKDWVNLGVSVYRDRCGNQLVAFPTPQFTGFTSVEANSPALVQNQGLEGRITAKIINTKNITWSFNFNISFNENKLVSYPNFALSPFAGSYVIGQPLNIVHLLHYTGVDPQTGQYTYEDKNHDGKIDRNVDATSDLYNYNLNPKFFGGFGTDFTYKGFSLTLFFSYKDQLGQNVISSGLFPGTVQNQPTSLLGKEWKYPGDVASVARFTTEPVATDQDLRDSDAGLTNASYVRCKIASLSYNFPASYVHKVGMQNGAVFVRGQNLFVITPFRGLDPEVQNFGGLQPAKIFTAGLTLNF